MVTNLTRSSMSSSLLTKDVYCICYTEKDSMEICRGDFAAAREVFLRGDRKTVKVHKKEIIKGFEGRIKGRLSNRGVYWKKIANGVALEESFDQKFGCVFIVRDFNNVITKKEFYDSSQLWIKTEYYEAGNLSYAQTIFKPVASFNAIERFDYSADDKMYVSYLLYPVPYMIGSVEHSLINARFGDPQLIVVTNTGEFCYCPEEDARQRKEAMDQDFDDDTAKLMPGWDMHDVLNFEINEKVSKNPYRDVTFSGLDDYAVMTPMSRRMTKKIAQSPSSAHADEASGDNPLYGLSASALTPAGETRTFSASTLKDEPKEVPTKQAPARPSPQPEHTQIFTPPVEGFDDDPSIDTSYYEPKTLLQENLPPEYPISPIKEEILQMDKNHMNDHSVNENTNATKSFANTSQRKPNTTPKMTEKAKLSPPAQVQNKYSGKSTRTAATAPGTAPAVDRTTKVDSAEKSNIFSSSDDGMNDFSHEKRRTRPVRRDRAKEPDADEIIAAAKRTLGYEFHESYDWPTLRFREGYLPDSMTDDENKQSGNGNENQKRPSYLTPESFKAEEASSETLQLSGYRGAVIDGKLSGRGRTEQQNGVTAFDGEYLEGKRNGFGSCYYRGGNLCYSGFWKENKRHGLGVSFRSIDHALHISTWNLDEAGSFVSLFDPEGNLQYSGRLQNNKRDGAGVSYNQERNTLFVGKWKNNAPTGYGSVFDENGNLVYSGMWKNSKRSGNGTQFDTDGSIIFSGQWDDDKQVEGIYYKSPPKTKTVEHAITP